MRNKLVINLFFFLSCLTVMAQGVSVIPMPNKLSVGKGAVTIVQGARIGIADESLRQAANYLATAMARDFGLNMPVVVGKGIITLALDAKAAPQTDAMTGATAKAQSASMPVTAGAYRLAVTRGRVELSASDHCGMVNAIATLRQVMRKEGSRVEVPRVEVSDKPRYGWRGLMIDCSRHFYTVDELKHLLDVMAFYKLNKFHWHLTDDQGWRIEIKRYPLLTQKGGWRKLNNQDSTCLRRAKEEDMPNLLLPEQKMRHAADGSLEYGGFYTQDDIRSIVAYAAERGIDVVPEIDMPGHSLAAIESYDGLSCFPQTGWGRLFTTPMCPGKDTMLEFCKNVWMEVFQLFPYEYVHIGGDEVDMKNWRACPDCQRRMRENHLTTEPQLQTWFNHYMEAFFRQHGKKMIAWDDVIDGGLSPYTTVMWWRSWLPAGPKKATSHGNELIDVPVSYFYLSQKYKPSLMPDIYAFDPYKTLNAEESKLVKGIHSCLWGESVASVDRMWYQLFPLLLTVSEKAWSDPSTMRYDDFQKRMVAQLPRLKAMGVKYRLPDITGLNHSNAFFDTDTVEVACIDSSVTIRYTTDGTIPQASSPEYKGKIVVDKSTKFMFRAFGADGRKGDIYRSEYLKQSLAPAVQPKERLVKGLKTVWHYYGGVTCKDIDTAEVRGSYLTPCVEIPAACKENIGLVISGYISVPTDGIYSFALLSDDGSQLTIDGDMVVDNDGEHDALELVGQRALKRGLHAISVRYFDHNGGTLHLRVTDKHGNEVKVEYLTPHGNI